jgi:hypothetical protein
MANEVKILTWTGDAGDVNIPIGYVPHHVRVIQITDTAPMVYEWFRRMELDEASGSQEGFQINGADGVTSKRADSQGITAYDAASVLPTVNEWTQARANAATARTSLANGTFIKATVGATDADGNVVDRSQIFECVTAGSGAASEPTWPVENGQQVTDSSVVWERVASEAIRRTGYQGIVFAAEVNENSKNYYMIATLADSEDTLGDVDGWPSGVQGG